MTIERDKTTLWRGLAILGIVIHNLLVGSFGFVGCNEMTFRMAKAEAFWNSLLHPSLSLIGDLFAFLGWIGVPVFVFLSGFGLEKKYGNNASFSAKEYLGYNYRKLFFLLLPAVFLYSVLFVVTHNWPSLLSSLLSLSLFGNIWHLQLPLNPSIYWYFGLTWELYLFYLVLKKANIQGKTLNYGMLALSMGSIILMIMAFYLFPENTHPLEWLRRNFIGWLPVFCLGIWMADTKKNIQLTDKSIWVFFIAVALFGIICLANLKFLSWLFVPFLALVIIVLIGELCYRIGWIRKVFVWIGGLSSYLFVVHPIAKGITHKAFGDHFILMLLSYLLLTFLLALGFRLAKEKVSQRVKS